MLHPQARFLLDLIEQGGLPPTHTLSPPDARAMYLKQRDFTQPSPPEVADMRNLQADGPHGPIPLHLYRPLGPPGTAVLPMLVYSIDTRDRGDLPIAFQLLIYTGTDVHRTAPSHVENGQGYLLTIETMDYFVGQYIADTAQYDDWRASPLLHPDLSSLPPALVLTAGFDPLRDEGAAYAERLTAAGSRASHVLFPRQIHGFVTMGKVIDEANAAVALCAAQLRRAFQPGARP